MTRRPVRLSLVLLHRARGGVVVVLRRARRDHRRVRAGRRGDRHDAHAGDGAEPAERDAARALVQLGAAAAARRRSRRCTTTSPRSRRRSSTKGTRDGVRGDIAFVQSILETGWFSFQGSQIPPDANNFAGIYAFDGRTGLPNCAHGDSSPSRCFPSADDRRAHADPAAAELRRRDDEEPAGPLALRAVGPRRRRADLGVLRRHQLPVRQAHLGEREELRHPHPEDVLRGARVQRRERARACRTRRATTRTTRATATGWRPTSRTSTRSAPRTTTATPARPHLNKPLIGGEATSNGNGLLAARARRRHLHVRRRPSSTARPAGVHLNQPINGMERTADNGGYWLVAYDGGIFTFGNAKFHGSTGSMHLNQPVLGMERTASGHGYWLFARDGGVFTLRRRASSTARPAACTSSSPVVAMQRTPSGHGYWMLTPSGRVLRVRRRAQARRHQRLHQLRRREPPARVADGQGLLDRDRRRQRDRLRRRAAARLPGRRSRPARRVDALTRLPGHHRGGPGASHLTETVRRPNRSVLGKRQEGS